MTNQNVKSSTPSESFGDESLTMPPQVAEFVVVQAGGFRCAAYRGKDGKWRGAYGNEELAGEIFVISR